MNKALKEVEYHLSMAMSLKKRIESEYMTETERNGLKFESGWHCDQARDIWFGIYPDSERKFECD